MTAVIVFGYLPGRLANATFRAYKRARRATRAKGLGTRVELRPLDDLPPVIDVLVLDAPFDPVALAGVEVRATLIAPPDRSPATLETHLEALVERGVIGPAVAPPRTIAVHRGVQPLTERARVADAS